MPLPGSMQDLSTTAALNSPAGGDPVGTSLDNYLRSIQAVIRSTNAKGADIASASSIDLGAATGEFVTVTGTTTITSLGTVDAGIARTVHFSGALTITHNATSLILPGGRNIVTAAGDVAQFRSLGSGNWRCVGLARAGDGGAGAQITVETVAAMKALTGLVDGAAVQRLGYASAGDIGEDAIRYDAGSAAASNDYNTYTPNTMPGRFLVVRTDKKADIRRAGAKNDGSDSGPKIQTIIDAGDVPVIPLLSAGFTVASQVILPDNSTVEAEKRNAKLIKSGSFDLFRVQGNDVSIKGLRIDNNSASGGLDILLKTGTGSYDRIYISEIISDAPFGFIADENGAGTVITLEMRDVVVKKLRGIGANFRDVFAYGLMRNVTFDYIGSASPNFAAIVLDNNQGFKFERVDATGTVGTSAQKGFDINNSAGITFEDTLMDSLGGRGYEITGSSSGIQMTDARASLCNEEGFYFSGINGLSAANIKVVGRNGLGGAVNKDGILVDTGSINCRYTGVSVASCTGHGFNFAGGASHVVSGLQSYSNALRGLRTGTTGSIVVSGVGFSGNTVGNYDLGAVLHKMYSAQLASGAFVDAQAGIATG